MAGNIVTETAANPALADIIPLPTASATPIVNRRRVGRFPRGVVSLAQFRRDRSYQQFLREVREEKIAQYRGFSQLWAIEADKLEAQGDETAEVHHA